VGIQLKGITGDVQVTTFGMVLQAVHIFGDPGTK